VIEIMILLLLFLGIGILARKFDGWIRLLLCVLIAGVIALLYFA